MKVVFEFNENLIAINNAATFTNMFKESELIAIICDRLVEIITKTTSPRELPMIVPAIMSPRIHHLIGLGLSSILMKYTAEIRPYPLQTYREIHNLFILEFHRTLDLQNEIIMYFPVEGDVSCINFTIDFDNKWKIRIT